MSDIKNEIDYYFLKFSHDQCKELYKVTIR